MAGTATKPDRGKVVDEATAERYRHWLRQMLLIRHFEEKAGEAYSLGKIGGFCHLYIGQEALAVGTLAALRPDDYVISAYREHGQALASRRPLHRYSIATDQTGRAVFGDEHKGPDPVTCLGAI